jgi:hypothetical protein
LADASLDKIAESCGEIYTWARSRDELDTFKLNVGYTQLRGEMKYDCTCVWLVSGFDGAVRSVIRRASTLAIACVSLALWGCGGAEEQPGAQPPARAAGQESEQSAARGPELAEQPAHPARPAAADSVTVVFTKDEAPAPVRRPVPDSTPLLRAALEWLVRGPNPEERTAGIRSWFSGATAESLRSVEVDSAGRAVVDFHDLRRLIPNASSSFGSAMLLQELNGTVFQFPEIRSVEYLMEGSCDLFWEWLQYGCQTVVRPKDVDNSGEPSLTHDFGSQYENQ